MSRWPGVVCFYPPPSGRGLGLAPLQLGRCGQGRLCGGGAGLLFAGHPLAGAFLAVRGLLVAWAVAINGWGKELRRIGAPPSSKCPGSSTRSPIYSFAPYCSDEALWPSTPCGDFSFYLGELSNLGHEESALATQNCTMAYRHRHASAFLPMQVSPGTTGTSAVRLGESGNPTIRKGSMSWGDPLPIPKLVPGEFTQ